MFQRLSKFRDKVEKLGGSTPAAPAPEPQPAPSVEQNFDDITAVTPLTGETNEAKEEVSPLNYVFIIVALAAILGTYALGISVHMQLKSAATKITAKSPAGVGAGMAEKNIGGRLDVMVEDSKDLSNEMKRLNNKMEGILIPNEIYEKLKSVEDEYPKLNKALEAYSPGFASCSTSLIVGSQTLKSGEEAYCDSGYRVFQRRVDTKVSFGETWQKFKDGFGTLSGDFWIGLHKLHGMTIGSKICKLRVIVWDDVHLMKYADYQNFYVENERNNYKLHLQWSSGLLVDGLSAYDGIPFSTLDKDNDNNPSQSCAERGNNTGWWYNDCSVSNLNLLAGRMVWNDKRVHSAQMMVDCDD